MSIRVERVFGVGQWRSPSPESRRRFGVPPGGPWDRESAQIANAYVGNDPDHPVFELLQGSVELGVEEPGTIAILSLLGTVKLNDQALTANHRISVQPGDRLSVAAHLAYISFKQATIPPARLESQIRSPNALRYIPAALSVGSLELEVSRTSNRAGTRLIGLLPEPVLELPSEPSCVGAIQRTPSGELIVIGPDGPTVGGYPRLGTVIESDLCLLPRLKPDSWLRLIPVSLEQAFEINKAEKEMLYRTIAMLKAMQP